MVVGEILNGIGVSGSSCGRGIVDVKTEMGVKEVQNVGVVVL